METRSPSATPTERAYEFPRGERRYHQTLCAIGIALLVAGAAIHGHPIVALLIPFPLTLVAYFATSIEASNNTVRETADGLVVRLAGSSNKHQIIPWAAIARFGGSRFGTVFAETNSGRRIRVGYLTPRATARWQGGETGDIVGELNRRLAAWRGAGSFAGRA
jgi:hypothetical protein